MSRSVIFVETSMTLCLTQKEIWRLPRTRFIWRPSQRRQWKLLQTHNQLTQLITTLFKRPKKILELYQQETMILQAIKTLSPYLDETIDTFMIKNHPLWWENIPLLLKAKIYRQAKKQLPLFLDNLFEILFDRADELIDFNALIMDQLQKNPVLLRTFTHLMQSIHLRQFFSLTPSALSLNHFITREFLTPNALIQGLFTGPAPSKTRNIIHQQLKLWVEGPLLKPTLQCLLGFTGYLHFKNQLTDYVVELLRKPLMPLDIQQERTNRLSEYCMEGLSRYLQEGKI